ncbi:hypothetical protein ACFLWI_00610 [Chloroflexota bacterium]
MDIKVELGYSRDIALEQLIQLFLTNDGFLSDTIELQAKLYKYAPAIYLDALVHSIDTHSPSDQKHKDIYSFLAQKWSRTWQDYLRSIPSNFKLEIEILSQKWGLRCPWGCGFVTDHGFHNYTQGGMKGDGIKYPDILLQFTFQPVPTEIRSTLKLLMSTDIGATLR